MLHRLGAQRLLGQRFVRNHTTSQQREIVASSEQLFLKLKASSPFFLIAGTNVIESQDDIERIATGVMEAIQPNKVNGLDLQVIFKASWDKANRTSVNGYRGIGMQEGLQVLEWVKQTFNVPVTTDVHETQQVHAVAEVADIIQIPSFLCRQTDLLLTAGRSGRIVNIKKGQFANAGIMHAAAEKVKSTGNPLILLCERGNSYGPSDLVFDPRNLALLRASGYPVVMDVTHTCQQTADLHVDRSSGSRAMVPVVARAAAATGVDGIFIECHHDINNAPVDGGLQWPVENLSELVCELADIAMASKGRSHTI